MRPRLDAANRRELERLARVRPVPAAASALCRPVVQQKPMTKAVPRPSDAEVQGVLAHLERFSRPPPDRKVFRPERRHVRAERFRHRTVGALADRAHLAVHLAGRGEGVGPRQRRLDVALEPLIAEVLGDAGFLGVVEQRIREPERAPSGIEVERPVDRPRQPGRLGRRGRVLCARGDRQNGDEREAHNCPGQQRHDVSWISGIPCLGRDERRASGQADFSTCPPN